MPQPWVQRDLDQIRAEGVLRVLTRNNASCYFIYRGHQLGYEVELTRALARELGVRLEVVAPPSRKDLVPWLESGRGDLVAAGVPAWSLLERRTRLSQPYRHVLPALVTRPSRPAPLRFADLAGMTISLPSGSPYEARLLEAAREENVTLTLQRLPGSREEREILEEVGSGRLEATVADRRVALQENAIRGNLHIGLALGDPLPLRWAVRPNAPRLHAALNAFLEQQEGSLFLAVLEQKYFHTRTPLGQAAGAEEGISPWDHLFLAEGRRHEFDWRFLAALAYQESRFDPERISWAGAVGIMQLLPATAHALAVTDLHDPHENVAAGTAYLRWLVDLLQPRDARVPPRNPYLLALVAYNAGLGHVVDARLLAERLGGHRDDWDDVSHALTLLEQPAYYRSTRSGFVRGREAVAFAEEVWRRFQEYRQAYPEVPSPPTGEPPVATLPPTDRAVPPAPPAADAVAGPPPPATGTVREPVEPPTDPPAREPSSGRSPGAGSSSAAGD
jgi:membrane-bound lytic murein transglycosylase F